MLSENLFEVYVFGDDATPIQFFMASLRELNVF